MCAMALSQLRRGFPFILSFARWIYCLAFKDREKATRHLRKRPQVLEPGGEGESGLHVTGDQGLPGAAQTGSAVSFPAATFLWDS